MAQNLLPRGRHVIYGLFDPQTSELRYVGYTSDMSERYRLHMSACNLVRPSHKNHWIKKLGREGREPEMDVLEEYATAEELPQAEIESIEYYKFIGCVLTNSNKGGKGGHLGEKLSDETKKLLSDLAKGRYAGEKNPMYGKTHTQEVRDIIGAKNKERYSNGKAPFTGRHHTSENKQLFRENQIARGWIGEKHPSAKLNNEKVYSILTSYYVDKLTPLEIASLYAIDRSTIYDILNENRWNEVYDSFYEQHEELIENFISKDDELTYNVLHGFYVERSTMKELALKYDLDSRMVNSYVLGVDRKRVFNRFAIAYQQQIDQFKLDQAHEEALEFNLLYDYFILRCSKHELVAKYGLPIQTIHYIVKGTTRKTSFALFMRQYGHQVPSSMLTKRPIKRKPKDISTI